jgi:hypothetical protein
MSLRELNPRTRRRLRFHGWLLTLWCVLLGVAASWFLLRVMHLRQPAARYAISAIVMYSCGLLLGVRYWLGHFAASVRAEAGLLGTADALDRASFEGERREDFAQTRRAIGEKFDWGFGIIDVADLLSFSELSVFLLIPAVILIAIGVLMLVGYAPMLMIDGLAALLAEMAVQFIFGALIARRTMRVTSRDDPFLHIVGKTWLAGLLLVVVSAGAGWLLTWIEPGAASVGDLVRHGALRP